MALFEVLLGLLDLVLPSRDPRIRRYERLGCLLGLSAVAVGLIALVIGHARALNS